MESKLVVGQKYKIPTIRGEPVLLPKHTDPEFFNFDKEHYHLDYRFVPDALPNLRTVLAAYDSPVVYEDRECVRESHPVHPGFVFSLWHMMIHYRWSSLKCGICPHKGIKTGEGSCPGHGLIWDSEGLLKHRNCRLYVRLNHSQVIQEIGWTYKPVVVIHVTAPMLVTELWLLADNEQLGSMPFHAGHVMVGDTLTVREQR